MSYRDSGRARNWNEVLTLSENPSKRNLTRGSAVLGPNVLKTFDKLQDIGEV
jgi:hypothetical protein